MPKTIKLNHDQLSELLENLKEIQAERGDWRGLLVESLETVEAWTEATAEPERVVFRKFKDGEVIALFPDQYSPRNGMIGSYMHNGQHSDTVPHFGDTKAAEWGDYADLYRELQGQGYTNLKVVKRLNVKR